MHNIQENDIYSVNVKVSGMYKGSNENNHISKAGVNLHSKKEINQKN